METTCPKLQEKNLNAAKMICNDLKNAKVLSDKQFIDKLIFYRKGHRSERHPKNFENIIAFLKFHKLVTFQKVNGFSTWAATQKLVRSKEENLFMVKQDVLRSDIQKAIQYQKLNGGLISPGVEGKIIAENILKLKGQIVLTFIAQYIHNMEFLQKHNLICFEDAITGPLYGGIREIKLVMDTKTPLHTPHPNATICDSCPHKK